MKNTFPGYYCPSEDEFLFLWKNCIFILDANIILNLYRYSKETSDAFIDILNHVSDRLWIPHQAGFEYQKNRLEVISNQFDVYDEVTKTIEKFEDQVTQKLSRHPYIDQTIVLRKMKRGLNSVKKYLNETREKHPDLLDNDVLRETISTLLTGKVGLPYSDEKKNEIFKIGEKRYKNKIPPGYMDDSKNFEVEKYGDLILWFQLIDEGIKSKKPIILISDDSKEDWIYKFKGKTIGPRPELIEEVRSKADVMFYLYQADPFMENAKKFLKKEVKQEAIDEVREIRKRDEIIINVTSGATVNQPYLDSIRALESAINAAGAAVFQPYINSINAAGAVVNQPYLDSIRALESSIQAAGVATIKPYLDSIQGMASIQAAAISQNLYSKLNGIENDETTSDSFKEENEHDGEE